MQFPLHSHPPICPLWLRVKTVLCCPLCEPLSHPCPLQGKRARWINWLPQYLGVNTDAMFMPSSFRMVLLWACGVILACVGAPVAFVLSVVSLVNARNQSAAVAVLVSAANQTMPGGEHREGASSAGGVLSILLVFGTILATFFTLFTIGASMVKSIHKDDTPVLASCLSRLEVMHQLNIQLNDDHIAVIIGQSGVYRADKALNAAEMRAEVEACLNILRDIEREQKVLHGGQDPSGSAIRASKVAQILNKGRRSGRRSSQSIGPQRASTPGATGAAGSVGV